jgi:hypothetical protein
MAMENGSEDIQQKIAQLEALRPTLGREEVQ